MSYYPKTPYGQLSSVITRSAHCSDSRHDLIVAIIERTALDAAGFTSPLCNQNADELRADAEHFMGTPRFARFCQAVDLDPKRVVRWTRQSDSIRKMKGRGEMRTPESTRAWGEALWSEDDPFGEAIVEIADAWAVDRETRAAEVTKRVLIDLFTEMMDASDDREKGVDAKAMAQAAQFIKDYAARV